MASAMDQTPVPLNDPLTKDLKLDVRSQLEEYWKFHRRDIMFRRETKLNWLDSNRIRTLDEGTPQLKPSMLSRFCNKTTTLYVAPSGQVNNHCHMINFGCIYEQWFSYHNNEANIEFGHFFADPVRITSSGPETVVEIIQSHKLFCDQASELLNRLGQGEEIYPCCKLSAENYKQLPLCRAIVFILDDVQFIDGDEDERVSLDKHSQVQSVLMALTGEESRLSAPISFEQIKAQALPLRRDDCNLEGLEVVRVSLKTAVRFIANLQQREEAAFSSKTNGHVIERYLCPIVPGCDYADLPLSAHAWAEKILQKADELGFENVGDAENALRRAIAARRGDESAKLTPIHFNRIWK